MEFRIPHRDMSLSGQRNHFGPKETEPHSCKWEVTDSPQEDPNKKIDIFSRCNRGSIGRVLVIIYTPYERGNKRKGTKRGNGRFLYFMEVQYTHKTKTTQTTKQTPNNTPTHKKHTLSDSIGPK